MQTLRSGAHSWPVQNASNCDVHVADNIVRHAAHGHSKCSHVRVIQKKMTAMMPATTGENTHDTTIAAIPLSGNFALWSIFAQMTTSAPPTTRPHPTMPLHVVHSHSAMRSGGTATSACNLGIHTRSTILALILLRPKSTCSRTRVAGAG